MFTKLVKQFIRFAGIGFLNTAVDYSIFNLIAATFQIFKGPQAGYFTAVSFSVAVLHSFYWNKFWAFGQVGESESFSQNVGQFITAAIVGAVVIGLVIFGSDKQYPAYYYVLMLAMLVAGELFLWKMFQLHQNPLAGQSGQELGTFILVSLVGVAINYLIVSQGSTHIPPRFGLNQQLWTNLIKVVATGVALVWNFLGYKIFVFKK